jgi:hypothetical protein
MQVGRTPSHRVAVSNQFGGNRTLTIGRPFLLAVPSSKNARRWRWRHRRELFCNPTLKYVPGPPPRRYKIVNRDAHLVCYGLKAPEFSKKLIATNQFGRVKLAVLRPDRLCVPSKKLKHTP